MAVSVPGPALTPRRSQGPALGAEGEKAQWLPLTPRLALTNAPLWHGRLRTDGGMEGRKEGALEDKVVLWIVIRDI